MGDVFLEIVSKRVKCFYTTKSLLSVSTVFTYLPVFKIFVKSGGNLPLIKFESIQDFPRVLLSVTFCHSQ